RKSKKQRNRGLGLVRLAPDCISFHHGFHILPLSAPPGVRARIVAPTISISVLSLPKGYTMRNVHARIIAGGLAVAVLILAGSSAQAQTTLRYKFNKGEKVNYEAEQKMSMKMNVMGNDVTMNMNMKMSLTQEVTGVTGDGKGQVTQKIGHISF